ncbi:hypothetical protein pb186bvf_004293 [Paramecium bursaria]
MKIYHTPNSTHSRKSSVKIGRQPLGVISNYQDATAQCASYLQQKVNGLEMRVKNLNSQHSENRSTTANKDQGPPPLSPCIATKQKKVFQSTNKNCNIDTQSYYETIINKRLENIIDKQPSPHIQKWPSNHMYTDNETSTKKFTEQVNKLHQNALIRIQYLTKKLRKFKLIKDQNQDECAPSLAKIKCFCQDYYQDCFDFYRCTDLIALKYFIYLLLQELNLWHSQNAFKTADYQLQYQTQIDHLKEKLDSQKNDSSTYQTQMKLQKMVSDTQGILEEIILGLQNKNNQNSLVQQVEILNNQMKKIKDKLHDTSTDKYPQSTVYKTGNSFLEDRSITQYSSKSKSPFNKPRLQSDCDNSRDHQIDHNNKVFQEQKTHIQQLVETVYKQQNEFKNKEKDYAKKLSSIHDDIKSKNLIINALELDKQKIDSERHKIQLELNRLADEHQSQVQRIKEISKNLDQVIKENLSLKQENEKLQNSQQNIIQIEQKYLEMLNQKQEDFEQIKQTQQESFKKDKLIQQFEAENEYFRTQCEKLTEAFNMQENDFIEMQQGKDQQAQDMIRQLSDKLLDQNKIIGILVEEANYFAHLLQYVYEIVPRVQGDGVPTTILMLQKDLMSKKPLIQQKMRVLSQFNQNLKGQSGENSTNIVQDDIDLLENLQSEPSFSEFMNTQNSSKNQYNHSVSQTQTQRNVSHNIQSNINNSDVSAMLVLQAHTIEKIMEW